MAVSDNYTVYTHRVVTEDNGPMYYVGVTINPKQRWYASCYCETALKPYIDKYGWDNIEHRVFADGLDYEMARKLEDTLIQLYRHFDSCINYNRSGLIEVSDKNAYEAERYKRPEVRQHMREQQREYSHRPEVKERRREYRRNFEREYNKTERGNEVNRKKRARFNSKPENKIYSRVHDFNRRHPDRIVETPLEAKKRYLEQHIIPDYIKNNDLK